MRLSQLAAPLSPSLQWLEESAFSSAAIILSPSKRHKRVHMRMHMLMQTHTHTQNYYSSDSSKSPLAGNLLTLQPESRFK